MKTIHKLSFAGRIHGHHLHNVQLDCGEIAKRVMPYGNRGIGELAFRGDKTVLKSGQVMNTLCAACFTTDQPREGCDNYVLVTEWETK